MYMPSSSGGNNIKSYTKTNSRSNLLNDHANTVKREKSPKNLSPKFNLNF